jgi:hypothetical protein
MFLCSGVGQWLWQRQQRPLQSWLLPLLLLAHWCDSKTASHSDILGQFDTSCQLTPARSAGVTLLLGPGLGGTRLGGLLSIECVWKVEGMGCKLCVAVLVCAWGGMGSRERGAWRLPTCPCALQQQQDGSLSGLPGQLPLLQLMPAVCAGVPCCMVPGPPESG